MPHAINHAAITIATIHQEIEGKGQKLGVSQGNTLKRHIVLRAKDLIDAHITIVAAKVVKLSQSRLYIPRADYTN